MNSGVLGIKRKSRPSSVCAPSSCCDLPSHRSPESTLDHGSHRRGVSPVPGESPLLACWPSAAEERVRGIRRACRTSPCSRGSTGSRLALPLHHSVGRPAARPRRPRHPSRRIGAGRKKRHNGHACSDLPTSATLRVRQDEAGVRRPGRPTASRENARARCCHLRARLPTVPRCPVSIRTACLKSCRRASRPRIRSDPTTHDQQALRKVRLSRRVSTASGGYRRPQSNVPSPSAVPALRTAEIGALR
jgi:hypothetical protein